MTGLIDPVGWLVLYVNLAGPQVAQIGQTLLWIFL